nr:hypothetical protein [Tanacetum cinerariifolium]
REKPRGIHRRHGYQNQDGAGLTQGNQGNTIDRQKGPDWRPRLSALCADMFSIRVPQRSEFLVASNHLRDDYQNGNLLREDPNPSREDYDEKREMEPRPEPTKEATPPLRLRSPGVCRQQKRVVWFEESPNKEGSKAGRNAEGSRPSEIKARENGNRGMNLPLTLGSSLSKKQKRSTPAILFDLCIWRPSTFN